MIARVLLFTGCLLALATCQIPIGRDGAYGAVFVGYKLPDFSQPPPDADTLADK